METKRDLSVQIRSSSFHANKERNIYSRRTFWRYINKDNILYQVWKVYTNKEKLIYPVPEFRCSHKQRETHLPKFVQTKKDLFIQVRSSGVYKHKERSVYSGPED